MDPDLDPRGRYVLGPAGYVGEKDWSPRADCSPPRPHNPETLTSLAGLKVFFRMTFEAPSCSGLPGSRESFTCENASNPSRAVCACLWPFWLSVPFKYVLKETNVLCPAEDGYYCGQRDRQGRHGVVKGPRGFMFCSEFPLQAGSANKECSQSKWFKFIDSMPLSFFKHSERCPSPVAASTSRRWTRRMRHKEPALRPFRGWSQWEFLRLCLGPKAGVSHVRSLPLKAFI